LAVRIGIRIAVLRGVGPAVPIGIDIGLPAGPGIRLVLIAVQPTTCAIEMLAVWVPEKVSAVQAPEIPVVLIDHRGESPVAIKVVRSSSHIRPAGDPIAT
jgi:hypothetical protein